MSPPSPAPARTREAWPRGGSLLPANSGREPADADALEAADDDTGRTVPEGEVRGAGANDIGGLERRVHRDPAGADGLVFRR